MHNWAGNFQYQAAALHEPQSVDELREIVRLRPRVRVLGTRHSFNSIADCPGGDLISLRRLNRVIRFDANPTQPTVTVQGGITYGELCPQLHRGGWALHNLASLPHISVAGACATATHGSGDRNGNLATAIVAMKIVNAAGREIEVSPQTMGEKFRGMVVALGALGPVTELTLKIEPSYEVRQQVFLNLPVVQLQNHFDDITSAADSVSLFTDWRTPAINQVWLKQRFKNGHDPRPGPDFFGAIRATVHMNPLAELSADNCNEQLGIAGPWHHRLPHFRLDFTPSHGVELQAEYFVPRRRALEAIDAVYSLRGEISPILKISELRTIAADELWLSPCYHRDCLAIHFTWEQDVDAVMAVLPKIENRLRDFGVRPHWGKLFTMNGPELEAAFADRFASFRQLLLEYDPAGKFRNEFLNTAVFSNT